MALPDQELVLEIKQEPAWRDEYSSNPEGFEVDLKEDDERSPRSPDSQGTENIEMGDLDNESATVEDLGEEWCEEEAGNLCDPLCHMTSDVLRSPESSDGGDAVSYGSKRGTMPKGGAQAGRRGKALKRSSRVQTKPTPTRANPSGKRGDQTSHVHDLEEDGVLSDTPQSVEKRTETDSPLSKKKRKITRLSLTDEQEEGLVEWLQSKPELFDKSNRRYKDIDLKNSLWEDKAAELDVGSGELLQVWYKSMRTRFGKLRKIKRRREFTWRDQWILKNFAFISPHIYACPNRGAAFPKQKLQSRPIGPWPTPQQHSGSEDDDNDDDLYNIPTIPSSTLAPSTSATPSSASAICNGPVKIEPSQSALGPDATLVQQVSESGAQANQLLAGISAAILCGQNNSMAKGYGTFLSTVVPSLHPSLLTQFYQDSWAMVMRYHMKSEQLKEKERHRPLVPVAVRPADPSPQLPKSNSQPSSHSRRSSQVQPVSTQQSLQDQQQLQQP